MLHIVKQGTETLYCSTLHCLHPSPSFHQPSELLKWLLKWPPCSYSWPCPICSSCSRQNKLTDPIRSLHCFKIPQWRCASPSGQRLKHSCGCPAVHQLASAQSSDFITHTSFHLLSKPRQNRAGHLSVPQVHHILPNTCDCDLLLSPDRVLLLFCPTG